jgi:polar amino acid transport system substrate-binding protein
VTKAVSSIVVSVLASACATGGATSRPEAKEIAPKGTLRAAINYGNAVLAQKDPATGEPRGISVDLARELSRRLGVPLEVVPFEAAGKVFEAAKTGAWDVAFLAADPARAEDISFSAPYLVIDGTYLVPKDSPIHSVEDADKDGIRIAVGKKSAYDLYLSRTLKHAQIVRAETTPGAIDLFLQERLDAAAGIKQVFVRVAKENATVRVVDGRFMRIEQAMAVPKGREGAAKYVRDFVEEMKASGFLAQSLEKNGQRDSEVAPAAR